VIFWWTLTERVGSVAAALFLTLGVFWLYAIQVYSQPGNENGNHTGNSDPAYPRVCIESPPLDLNCPDVPHEQYKVLPPDPHRLDRDGNGIRCKGEL
jgi:hypothetical protein